MTPQEKAELFGIEVGPGNYPRRPKFCGVDIEPEAEGDVLANSWELGNHFNPGTVKTIFSRHSFEHLTFRQGEEALKCWWVILKPGATVELILPNLWFHIHQWTHRANDAEYKDAIRGLYGGQRNQWNGGDLGDVHKSGYDAESLKKVVRSVGFRNFKSKNGSLHRHLHVTFKKPI